MRLLAILNQAHVVCNYGGALLVQIRSSGPWKLFPVAGDWLVHVHACREPARAWKKRYIVGVGGQSAGAAATECKRSRKARRLVLRTLAMLHPSAASSLLAAGRVSGGYKVHESRRTSPGLLEGAGGGYGALGKQRLP